LKFVLADKMAKPLDDNEMLELLRRPNLLRLAMIDIRDNLPFVHPIWFFYENNKFFASTESDGLKAKSIHNNPDVYFLIDVSPNDSPPRGIRGKGVAKIINNSEYAYKVTEKNIVKYMGSLDSQFAKHLLEISKESSVIEINPSYIASWKY
jgi:hypothetical protein